MRIAPALLTLLTAIPSVLSAVDIADGDAKVTVGLFSQARVDVARAHDSNGNSYSINDGASVAPDTADIYLKRFRPYIRGTAKGAIFVATLQADNWGKDSTGKDATSGANLSTTSVGLFEGYAGKEFMIDGIKHTITLGKQLSWFNFANNRPILMQFATNRATAALLAPVGVGAGYRLNSDMINLGLDVQNNTGDSTGSNTQDDGEGMAYTGRIEITGPKGSWNIGKWQESFAGADGQGIALSLDAGTNRADRTGTAGSFASENTTAFGIELLVHNDGLTALGEYRTQRKAKTFDSGSANVDTPAKIWLVQAGYAFKIDGGMALEPAVRYTNIDMVSDDSNEGNPYGVADWGNSGKQIDLGLNLFLAGHGHKVSALFTTWKGEENAAGEQADARIFRLQHQLMF